MRRFAATSETPTPDTRCVVWKHNPGRDLWVMRDAPAATNWHPSNEILVLASGSYEACQAALRLLSLP